MAEHDAGASPEEGRPQDLPQRYDVWQADARPVQLAAVGDATPLEPWLVVVTSLTDDELLAYELIGEKAGHEALLEVLRLAMLAPETGEPHRPTELQMKRDIWCEELKHHLDELNIVCQATDELPEVDAFFEELVEQLGQEELGLLDMPDMKPEQAASFFDAAALYYQNAPWNKTGDRVLRVEVPALPGGPWYAVVTGQGGIAVGLILYDSLETLRQIEQQDLSEEESANLSSALVVIFVNKDEAPLPDTEAAEEHGWRVAGTEAFPNVYKLEPGLEMRPPTPVELQVLEAALRAVPEFLRKKTRRQEPLTLAVPTGGGEVGVTLAWEEGEEE